MRLQRQVSRKYKGTPYHKHWVVVPNEQIKELGWDEGQELKSVVKDKKLVIEKE